MNLSLYCVILNVDIVNSINFCKKAFVNNNMILELRITDLEAEKMELACFFL